MLVESIGSSQAGLSDEDRAAIHQQLERLLVNPHFSNSRRFPSFLRFVVEHTLSGQTDVLKERTLGIEVFGKSADYDTASDPIVRVTAAEIRKRIAQYYQEPGHENELRLSLPSGSYIPQFHWPQRAKEEGAAPAATLLSTVSATPPVLPPEVIATEPARRLQSRAIVTAACLLTAAVFAIGIFLWKSMATSAFDFFWGPVLNSSDPVLFCIADQSEYSAIVLRDAADPTRQTELKDNLTAVVFDDLHPIIKIAGILQSKEKKYTLRSEGTTSLTDLRAGPTVFIGAFDNAWTLRMTKPLPYHFANDPEMTEFRIVDASDLSHARWSVNRLEQMATNNYRDYAIVARFSDNTTGKLAIIAAGIGRGGTIAAGEFLTDPNNLAQLAKAANAAGNKRNMEVVISTQIIGGEPGTPKMEAARFW